MDHGQQWIRRSVLVLALVVLVGCGAKAEVAAIKCRPSPFRHAKPWVIAHASSNYFGPGNSLEMMRAAVAAGADVVDADIRITSDGVLVAAHDDSLAVVAESNDLISMISYRDLSKLDLGDLWAGPSGSFPLRGKGSRVPTIEQLLIAFPDRPVSLEFKVTGGEQSLCTLIRRLNRANDVYVSSAGDAAIDTFKSLCPEVTTTVTDAMVFDMQAARRNPKSNWCATVPIGQPPFRGDLVTKSFVEWDHAHGLAVFTWTIDDPKTLEQLARSGVDGVYTGRADLARKIFDSVA
jgi:glycerophosphoryl diester phosphodiesterase